MSGQTNQTTMWSRPRRNSKRRKRAEIDYVEMSVRYGSVKLQVPPGFKSLLEHLTREILREQPKNIPEFAAAYFKHLLQKREDGQSDPAYLVSHRIVETKPAAETKPAVEEEVAQVSVPEGVTAEPEPPAQQAEDEMPDLNDPEVNKAATMIQASFRGFQARKSMSPSKTPNRQEVEHLREHANSLSAEDKPRARSDILRDMADAIENITVNAEDDTQSSLCVIVSETKRTSIDSEAYSESVIHSRAAEERRRQSDFYPMKRGGTIPAPARNSAPAVTDTRVNFSSDAEEQIVVVEEPIEETRAAVYDTEIAQSDLEAAENLLVGVIEEGRKKVERESLLSIERVDAEEEQLKEAPGESPIEKSAPEADSSAMDELQAPPAEQLPDASEEAVSMEEAKVELSETPLTEQNQAGLAKAAQMGEAQAEPAVLPKDLTVEIEESDLMDKAEAHVILQTEEHASVFQQDGDVAVEAEETSVDLPEATQSLAEDQQVSSEVDAPVVAQTEQLGAGFVEEPIIVPVDVTAVEEAFVEDVQAPVEEAVLQVRSPVEEVEAPLEEVALEVEAPVEEAALAVEAPVEEVQAPVEEAALEVQTTMEEAVDESVVASTEQAQNEEQQATVAGPTAEAEATVDPQDALVSENAACVAQIEEESAESSQTSASAGEQQSVDQNKEQVVDEKEAKAMEVEGDIAQEIVAPETENGEAAEQVESAPSQSVEEPAPEEKPEQSEAAPAEQSTETQEAPAVEQTEDTPEVAAAEESKETQDAPAVEETGDVQQAPAADEAPAPTEATEEAPAVTESAEEAPAATEATEEAPAATEAAEEAPAATEAAEEAPAATEAAEEAPAATEATEEAPAATEATEEAPAATEATEEIPAATEATEETPAATEATEETPAAMEATEETPAATEATEETPAATEEAPPAVADEPQQEQTKDEAPAPKETTEEAKQEETSAEAAPEASPAEEAPKTEDTEQAAEEPPAQAAEAEQPAAQAEEEQKPEESAEPAADAEKTEAAPAEEKPEEEPVVSMAEQDS